MDPCRACPLNGKHPNGRERVRVDPEIYPETAVLLVGEAPGYVEERKGKPFVGRSGTLLRTVVHRLLSENGFHTLKGKISITNACRCHPTTASGRTRPPTVDEINHCSPNLRADIERTRPKVIVALGKSAALALGVPAAREKLEKIRGRVFKTRYGPVMVTYHPSGVLRNKMKNIRLLIDDLRNAFRMALGENGLPYQVELRVVSDPEAVLSVLTDLRKNRRPFAFDYETVPVPWNLVPEHIPELAEAGLDPLSPYSDICAISFAWTEGDRVFAVSFPFRLRRTAERWLSAAREKLKSYRENRSFLVEKLSETATESDFIERDFYPIWRDFRLPASWVNFLEKCSGLARPVARRKIEARLREAERNLEKFTRLLEEYVRHDLAKDLDSETIQNALIGLLTDPEIPKVAQNPKFEHKFTAAKLGVEPVIQYGTDILDYLMGSPVNNLTELEKRYLPDLDRMKIELLAEAEKTTSPESFLRYNAADSAITYMVAKEETKRLSTLSGEERNKKKTLWNGYRKVTMKKLVLGAQEFLTGVVVPLLAHVELSGIRFDPEASFRTTERLMKVVKRHKRELSSIFGTGEVDTAEFKERFYRMFEKEPILSPKGGYSLARDALERVYRETRNETLRRTVVLVRTIKKIEKFVSTYLIPYPYFINRWTGRLHPSYLLTRTATGRLACEDPNVQQVPRDPFLLCPDCEVIPVEGDACPLCGREVQPFFHMKDLFHAEDDHVMVVADYSQMEVAILAELTKDPRLLEVVNQGRDFHSYNASLVYGIPYEEIRRLKDTDRNIKALRQKAKSVTFAVVYGATPEGIASRTGMSAEEAKKIIDTFYREYAQVAKWIEDRHRDAGRMQAVATPVGRIRWFPHAKEERQGQKGRALDGDVAREAQNTPIQSFASDLNLLAAELVRRKLNRDCHPLKPRARIVGLIHDSDMIEVPAELAEATKQTLERVMTEDVPRLKDVLLDLGLQRVADLVENLSVVLRAEAGVGKTWKEAS